MGVYAMSCQELTVGELKQKLMSEANLQIIDVREVEEYRAGHIEGSTLIPLGILPHRLDLIDRDKETVLVCRSGNRSREACTILQGRGFRKLSSLHGGLSSFSH